jgi:hypothetical protein
MLKNQDICALDCTRFALGCKALFDRNWDNSLGFNPPSRSRALPRSGRADAMNDERKHAEAVRARESRVCFYA